METEEVAVRENWVVKETCLQMDVMGKLLEEQGEHWILVMIVQWESFPQNPSPSNLNQHVRVCLSKTCSVKINSHTDIRCALSEFGSADLTLVCNIFEHREVLLSGKATIYLFSVNMA